ncbi:multidrug and toxin extrusion protein 1-like [Anneissia japonica]|uniref:multidrug and toxin extrusion protein 1-like n=1 Tax=Anneissia japonica TaxID=1529436 RepID=UPI001425A77D|nr:multidrug and toxin extrusion protein 1-like [Anneissia japonica]
MLSSFSFRWSAGSLTISLYVYLLILFVYIYMYENMEGWSIKCLDDWYEFSAIGTHGCLMVELEILIFEAGYFFCGTVGEMEVDVFGAVYIVIFYTFMICSGVASALAIRIGQSLEVNGIDQAKKSAKVGFVISWIYGAVVSVFFLVFHNYVGYIFTTDKKVVEQISSIVPMLITFEMSDLTSNIGKGVLQGCGRQSAGALTAFISYYFIGLPVCIYLVFMCGYGAKGMWIGLCVGNGTQAIGLLLYTFNIDWESEVKLCQERNGDFTLTEAEEESDMSENTDESGTSSRPKGSDKFKSSEKSRKTNKGNERPKNIEEGRRNNEITPLVEKSEFRLSRETIYMRIVNVTVATIICFAGIAYYVIGQS